MLTPSSMGTLLGLYDTFDAQFPPDLAAATAAVRTAKELVESVRRETEPAADVSTSKAVAASLDRISLWRATHTHRIAVAGELAKQAVRAELETFERTGPTFHADLGQWFEETGGRFVALLAELGGEVDAATNAARRRGDDHADLEAMAQRLTKIRIARSMLHGRLDVLSQPWQRWAQVLETGSLGNASRIPIALSGGLKAGPPAGTAAWWACVLSVPGVSLKYRSPAEQAARYAELAPKPAPVGV